ncbi:hypothetical protein L9F63_004566, partial [Diploptera punctata]
SNLIKINKSMEMFPLSRRYFIPMLLKLRFTLSYLTNLLQLFSFCFSDKQVNQGCQL